MKTIQTIEEAESVLDAVSENFSLRTNKIRSKIETILAQKKLAYISENDQEGSKKIWCLETISEIQWNWISAFLKCKKGDFYEAWCLLEQAEIRLKSLRRHYKYDNKFKLEFIEEHLPRFQSIFPYKIFMSPEMICKYICGICRSPVSPRKPCGHRKGEIYDGKLCTHECVELQLLATALVSNPVQKYSVIFPESGDNFDYSLVQYYIDAVESPFDGWNYEISTKNFDIKEFSRIGRNEPCPCGSEIKFKKCCLNKPHIARPHVQFSFEKIAKEIKPKII